MTDLGLRFTDAMGGLEMLVSGFNVAFGLVVAVVLVNVTAQSDFNRRSICISIALIDPCMLLAWTSRCGLSFKSF